MPRLRRGVKGDSPAPPIKAVNGRQLETYKSVMYARKYNPHIPDEEYEAIARECQARYDACTSVYIAK